MLLDQVDIYRHIYAYIYTKKYIHLFFIVFQHHFVLTSSNLLRVLLHCALAGRQEPRRNGNACQGKGQRGEGMGGGVGG